MELTDNNSIELTNLFLILIPKATLLIVCKWVAGVGVINSIDLKLWSIFNIMEDVW